MLPSFLRPHVHLGNCLCGCSFAKANAHVELHQISIIPNKTLLLKYGGTSTYKMTSVQFGHNCYKQGSCYPSFWIPRLPSKSNLATSIYFLIIPEIIIACFVQFTCLYVLLKEALKTLGR